MPEITLGRRAFLQVTATIAGGACFGLAPTARLHASTKGAALNGFVTIEPDGATVIGISQPDMGQGMYTTLAMLVGEELDADWERVSVRQMPLMIRRAANGEMEWALVPQGAGGSTSVVDLYQPLREFGARARRLLMRAAAVRLQVDVGALRTERGTVLHDASGRRLGYGELAAGAAQLTDEQAAPALKDPAAFRLIGKEVRAQQVQEVVTGRAQYGSDVRRPGMLHAVIARCPYFDGGLRSFDASAALELPGVRKVVAVPGPAPGAPATTLAAGVAVLADSTWAALQGRKALSIEWDEGPHRAETTAGFDAACQRALDAGPGQVVHDTGDFDRSFAAAKTRITQRYRLPYLPHATMEPQNCFADCRADRCEIIGPMQMPSGASRLVAELTGLDRTAIDVQMTRLGGGFGRRLTVDYAAEAALVSRAAGVPVHVQWTREDDMAHDFLRPGGWHELSAGLDAAGRVVAWRHRVASPSKYYRRVDAVAWESEIYSDDPPTGLVESVRYEYHEMQSGAWRGSWRAPAHTANAFTVQCFIDELADASGQDPLAFRLALLGEARELPYAQHGGPTWNPGRLAAVLKAAAEDAGWGRKLPPGEGLGIAGHFTFGGYVAWVAQVAIEPGARLRVRALWGAIDCGLAVNPNGVRAQMEGGACDALSHALGAELHIEGGRHLEGNFDTYRLMRIADAPPKVEVRIVPGGPTPTGVGEPPVPPLAPAVCNAIFAASGKRIRKLPIGEQLKA